MPRKPLMVDANDLALRSDIARMCSVDEKQVRRWEELYSYPKHVAVLGRGKVYLRSDPNL